MKNLADPLDDTSPNAIVTPLALPGVSSGKAKDPEVERLYSTNTVYDESVDEWAFVLKSYEGGAAYIGPDTIFKHQRETAADYKDRLAQSVYINYCQILNDYVPSFIYSQPIERTVSEGLRADFTKLEANCDRAGTHIDEFMRTASEFSRLFGMCFVGVDKPVAKMQPDAVSKAQEAEMGLAPYLYLVMPTEILDSHIGATGHYEYLKRLTTRREMVSFGVFKEMDEFTEWTAGFIKTSRVAEVMVDGVKEKRVVFSEIIPNQWNEVPLVPLFYKRSKSHRDRSVSFLRDIALLNRYATGLGSYLAEFLAKQCFNLLAIETSSRVPSKQDGNREIGSSNVLEFPENAKHVPQYVSPPTDPASFVQSERAYVIQEAYRIAAQDLGVQLFGGGSGNASSGDAARQSFGHVVPVIARMADACQMAEIAVFTLWAKMLGKTWEGEDCKVAYRDDYSISSTMTLILELSSILNNLKLISPTFIREEWLRIVREFDGKIARSKMEDIIREIKETSDDDILALYSKKTDTVATEGLPAVGNMIQGQEQAMLSTDENRSANGDTNAATKEIVGNDQRFPQGKKTVKDASD